MPTGAFTMLEESRIKRGMLAGGTEGGKVWLTIDDGAHWQHIDAGLPRLWVSRVTLSAKSVATTYVSFTGFREEDARPHLYASNDTGRGWRSIAANLPVGAVNVIKEDPADPDLGVYVSRDRGMSRETYTPRSPRRRCRTGFRGNRCPATGAGRARSWPV